MRIIYWGSSDFGIPCIEKLHQKHSVVAVIASPDKPQGRHLKVISGPIKIWAEKHNIDIFQPKKISGNDELLNILKSLKPDFFVVISYGKIIPEDYLKIPVFVPLNVHPSLLPKYRGPAPMEWALINGEKETGVSVISMVDEVDAGDIISVAKTIISDEDNIFTLRERLSYIAADVLMDAIEKVSSGYKGEKQSGNISYAPKLKKSDGHINWQDNAVSIHNKIRGLADWPGAYTFIVSTKGKRLLKIKKSRVEDASTIHNNPGRFLEDKKRMLVLCGQGILELISIQEEGKKETSAVEYLNGHHKILREAYLQ
ncbi:MAG TPA: methionyl-tRNA formyltransferase [bacterium]|nr:methionyl-tRNA formyltransferase [bacterium]